MNIKSILVEDNLSALDYLKTTLSNFSFIEIISTSTSCDDAIQKINFYKPDLLFLDIQIAKDTSFSILEACKGNYKYIIFITAYQEYALQSYNYNTIHYILKPYTKNDILLALNKIRNIHACFEPNMTTKELAEIQENNLQTRDGNNNDSSTEVFFYFANKRWQSIEISTVIYLEGDGSYTTFFTEKESVKITRNLKTNGEAFLKFSNFIRISSKHIVNTNHIETVIRGLKPKIILKNKKEFSVSILLRDNVFSKIGIKKK